MIRPVVEVFIPFVRIARMDPIRPTCNTKRVGGIRDAADISGIPGDFDAPGAVGNPDTSGIGNPDTSSIGNPDTPGTGNPSTSGIGNPDASGIGNPDTPSIGNPDTPGTGNPSTSGTGNPDTFDIPNIIGASGALGIDPRPADPSPGAADQDWSIWMSLGQAC